MSELGRLSELRSKKLKKTENQCQNLADEPKTTSEKLKFGSNKKLVLE